MLAWLASTAVCPRCRRRLRSNSSPTRNMNSSRPSWLRVFRCAWLPGGNTACETAGAIQPSSDGPRAMPIAISPTTCGWPIQRAATPANRAQATRTATENRSSGRLESPLAAAPRNAPVAVAAGACSQAPTCSAASTPTTGMPTSPAYSITTREILFTTVLSGVPSRHNTRVSVCRNSSNNRRARVAPAVPMCGRDGRLASLLQQANVGEAGKPATVGTTRTALHRRVSGGWSRRRRFDAVASSMMCMNGMPELIMTPR